MVACISRSLNSGEKNYSSYEGEMLGAVWAIKTFRHYLHGTTFTVVTDHRPLVWLMGSKDLVGKHARWALSIQEYDFTVTHRPGVTHANVDVPSRFPQSSSTDATGARMDEDALQQVHAPDVACLALAAGQPYSPVGAAVTWQGPDEGVIPPSPAWLLSGNLTCLDAHVQDAPGASLAQDLRRTAHAAVMLARKDPQWGKAANPAVVPAQFFTHACSSGVVLVELCGGLCAGLEMALRNDVKVKEYHYSDYDPVVRAVAHHRVRELTLKYPHLLRADAANTMFDALPQNVTAITREALLSAGAANGGQWLLVAGWDCCDLSPAGTNHGLNGAKSRSYHAVLQVLRTLQELQQEIPTAYVLENAATHHNFRSQYVREEVTAQLHAALGVPVTLDAAQFNSLAHRLRAYWTNLGDALVLQQVAARYQRDPKLQAVSVLEPGRSPQPVGRADSWPFFVCNKVGQPRAAFPTFVAFPGSHAFRDNGPGMVRDTHTGAMDEPWAIERERALGYAPNCTAAPEVSEVQRRAVLGRCIDINVLQSIYALTRRGGHQA